MVGVRPSQPNFKCAGLPFVAYTLVLGTIRMVRCARSGHKGSPQAVRLDSTIGNTSARFVRTPTIYGLCRSHSLRKALHRKISLSRWRRGPGLDDVIELVMPQFFGGPSFRDFWYPEFVGILCIAIDCMHSQGLKPGSYGGSVPAQSSISSPFNYRYWGVLVTSLPGLKILVRQAVSSAGYCYWVLYYESPSLYNWLPTKIGLGVRDTGFCGLVVGLGGLGEVAPRDPELALLVQNLRETDGWMLFGTACGLLACGLIHHYSKITAQWRSSDASSLLEVTLRYSPSVGTQVDPHS